MILQDLCGIGLHKTLPSHGSEERWRYLYPDGYRETGGENLEVLLILRRKVGKCRSHKMYFGVMERWFRMRGRSLEKARSGFTLSNCRCPTTLPYGKNHIDAIESLRENRSHAVCKSRKLLDMERFHNSLIG